MTTLNNKRVLIAVTNPLGGIRTYMLNHLSRMVDTGMHLTFLSQTGDVFEAFKKDVAYFPEVQFVETPKSHHKMVMVKPIRKLLHSGKIDLIHSQGLRVGTEAGIANFGINVPHIMTLHDVIIPQNEVPGKLKWLKKRVSTFFTRQINCIIPVSDDCRANHFEHFPQWRKGPCRVQTILNRIDIQRLISQQNNHLPDNNIRKQFSLSDDVIIGGFFGRFMEQKGFLPLLDALELLADRGYHDRFRLLVTQDYHGQNYIKKVQSRSCLNQMVCFVEPIGNIAPLLSQCNVLIMPSLWEACSILAMEALVLGVPVIGSDCLGLREVLKGTPSLTPEAGNVKAIVDAIEHYINSPWDNEAKAYMPFAQQRFNIETSINELQAIYEEFVRN